VNNTSSFLILAATSCALLLGLLTASAVVGSMRRRAGDQLSDEIEQAAGMEGRWNPRPTIDGVRSSDALGAETTVDATNRQQDRVIGTITLRKDRTKDHAAA
jgi:hypothetical protein